MNYNTLSFWLLFAAVYTVYWRLPHRRQNLLLLVTSYVFYGFWDYRFLFLILISTVIDFIGGMGVAGVRPQGAKLRGLALLIIGASAALCSNIHYGQIGAGIRHLDARIALAALPTHLWDAAIPAATLGAVLLYGRILPWLYTLPEPKRRKLFLTISMVANLSILGFFKYFGFFVSSAEAMLAMLGLPHGWGYTLHIILPAGISFYTFQAMSYTIDIYRGDAAPTTRFGDFALFVCFFPHLVAGPIMRAHTLLPQVTAPRRKSPEAMAEGWWLVLIGLFKKLVIADNMAPIANYVFHQFTAGGTGLTALDVWIGLYAFAFQIYGDFSGYSSIARGISKWLGFELMVNFRVPYLSVSPSDFWRRWHISLSSWLRDYLYIPLGGNRRGRLGTYRNLMLTMLLGGLWHGASWTFVGWGLYHGCLLCLFRALGIRDPEPSGGIAQRTVWALRVFAMFHITCIGWLLFRADSAHTVGAMLERLLTGYHLTAFATAGMATIVFYCGLLSLFEWAMDGERQLVRLMASPWAIRGASYAYLLAMLCIFPATRTYGFIYFQF